MAKMILRPAVHAYLFDHSLLELECDHHVKARPSADGSLIALAYDRISARYDDPIASSCRGLLLRPTWNAHDVSDPSTPAASDGWKQRVFGASQVVAWGMDRFPNAGERQGPDDIDWSDPALRVSDKLDGTLIHLYYDAVAGQWKCATRGVPDADVLIDDDQAKGIPGATFADLFRMALADTFWRATHKRQVQDGAFPPRAIPSPSRGSLDALVALTGLLQSHTYAFELTSPYNRVGVAYADKTATLIAARNVVTGLEVNIDDGAFADHWCLQGVDGSIYAPLPRAKLWDAWSLDEVRGLLQGIRADCVEGVVAVDSRFRRVKIKSEAWVFATQLKAGLGASPRRVLELVVGAQMDDVMPVLEEREKEQIRRFQGELGEWCAKADEEMRRLSTLAPSKCVTEFKGSAIYDQRKLDASFAALVKESAFPQALLFGMWRTQPWMEGRWGTGIDPSARCSALAYLSDCVARGCFSARLKDEILSALPPVQLVRKTEELSS